MIYDLILYREKIAKLFVPIRIIKLRINKFAHN